MSLLKNVSFDNAEGFLYSIITKQNKGEIYVDEVEREYRNSKEYREALAEYERSNRQLRTEDEYLVRFIDRMFRRREGASVKASRIHELYTEWASVNEKPILSQKGLGMKMRILLKAKRMGDGIYYVGIEENVFREPMYQLFSKKDDETDGGYYDREGVIDFVQSYWMHTNKGEELPGRFNDMSLKDIKKELDSIGVYAKSSYEGFLHETI